MYQKIRLAALFTLAVMTGAAYAAIPQVSNVTMGQIVNTRNVLITYDLTQADAIITLAIETNGVALPDSAVVTLTGDVNQEIAAGTAGEIIWQAGRDWVGNVADNARARITAWSKDNPPQVMVLDLSGGQSVAKYPVRYYSHIRSLRCGVTNRIYKYDQLVLQRIPSGGFIMGEEDTEKKVSVFLSRDFYIGVYQVTQHQWLNVMGSTSEAYFTDSSTKSFRPMEQIKYYDIRENPADKGSPIEPNWPATNAVGETSFMGILRSKTNIDGFDLPTEAQWEYACRAGTFTYYNDGNIAAPKDGVSLSATTSNTFMDVLGRYSYNGGRYLDETGAWQSAPATSGADQGTAIVGTYLPNVWGLYDMHGNVFEWCLDWYGDLEGGDDPVGVTTNSGSGRVMRGGSWSNYGAAQYCRSAYRRSQSPSSSHNSYGFRLACHLP